MQRSEAKDYLDIAALIEHGIDLAHGLACARAFYGGHFNVALPLKALCYFEDGDLSSLPPTIRIRLTQAVQAVTTIPWIPPSEMRIGRARS